MARKTRKRPFTAKMLEQQTPPALLAPGSEQPHSHWRFALAQWALAHEGFDAASPKTKPGPYRDRDLPLLDPSADATRHAITTEALVRRDQWQCSAHLLQAMKFFQAAVNAPHAHPELRALQPLESELERRQALGGSKPAKVRPGFNASDLAKAQPLGERLIELHRELDQVRQELFPLLRRGQSPIVRAELLAGDQDRTEAAFIWYMQHVFKVPSLRIAAIIGRLRHDGRAVDPKHPRAAEIRHTIDQTTREINRQIQKAEQAIAAQVLTRQEQGSTTGSAAMTKPADTTNEKLVNLQEASRLFGGIPPRTLRYWIARGRLRSVQPGRKHFVRVSDLEALLRDSERRSESEV